MTRKNFPKRVEGDFIEMAREAAAKAQANPSVAKMIISGDYDHWPNVQSAMNAINMVRGTETGI